MRLRRSVAAAAVGCAAVASAGSASVALAQPQGVTTPAGSAGSDTSAVEPTVVTASRTEQKIIDAIPNTTILTSRDIRESQAPDVLTLLRREAGIEAVQSGGIGSVSAVFMRGAEARQTLVLVDGLRIDSATVGAPALDQLLLEDIDRIEIVRGNVSSLYGSGAVGGVIQIFTKRGRGPVRGEVQAMGGSRDTYRISGSASGEVDATSFAVSALAYRTHGFSALDPTKVPGANPDDDGYRNESISAQIAHRFGDRLELGARAYWNRGKIQYDNAFAASPSDVNESKNEVSTYSAYAKGRPLDRWLATLTIGEGLDRNDNFLNGADDGRFKTTNRQVQLANEVDVGAGQTATAGYEYLQQRVDSSTPYTGTERTVNSGWLGYVGRFGPHQLQLNGRYDHYSDFGSANSWLAGYGYEITPAWKATVMGSTAFNAPTFNFLYFPNFGNPDLQPERSKSIEAGLQYAAKGNIARLVWFHTDYRDLIQNVAPTFLPQNVAEARVEGAELTWSGTLLGVDWRAAATWQDPESKPDGQQLLRRAKVYGSLSAAKSFADWRFGADLVASGPRPDISPTTFSRVTVPGYAVLNLTARWQITKAWWAALRIDNVFDRDYELVEGYNTPGFGMFVTVGWQPG